MASEPPPVPSGPLMSPEEIKIQADALRQTAADFSAQVLPKLRMPDSMPGPANTYLAALPPSHDVGHRLADVLQHLPVWADKSYKTVDLVTGVLNGCADDFPEIDKTGARRFQTADQSRDAMNKHLDGIEQKVPKMPAPGAAPSPPATA